MVGDIDVKVLEPFRIHVAFRKIPQETENSLHSGVSLMDGRHGEEGAARRR